MARSAAGISGVYDTVVLATTGLVSYWPLSETSGTTSTDSKDSNNGTYSGGFTLNQSGPSGNLTPSVTLNGSTGKITITDATNLNPGAPLSIEAWIKTSSASGQGIATKIHTSSPFAGYGLDISSGHKLEMWTGDLSGSWLIGATSINDGAWHHVVGTLSGTTVTLYVDGIQDGTGTRTPSLTNTDALLIGEDPASGPLWLNGSICGVALYNVALDATTIFNHAAAGFAIGNLIWGDVTFLDSASTALYSLWLKVAAWDAAFQGIWYKDDFPTQNAGWGFQRNSSSDGIVFFTRGSGGNATTTISSAAYAGAGWTHIAIYVPSSGNVLAYRDGIYTNVAEGGKLNPFGNNANNMQLQIGSSNISMAEAAVFTGLSQATAESMIPSLALGFSPMLMPVSPTFYAPLLGSNPEIDRIQGLSAPLLGGSAIVAGPKLYYPRKRLINPFVTPPTTAYGKLIGPGSGSLVSRGGGLIA